MEIFGNNFDDDLFESKKSTPQSTVRLDLSWTPNFCEPKWFAANKQNDGESMNFESPIEDSSVSKTHFHASHLYYTSKFLEASQLFVELLKKVPLTNFQLRREVSEGLSRSLMKLGKWDEAVEAANEFKLNCKSTAHFATIHGLFSEIYRQSLNYKKEMKHLQFVIINHKLNPTFWLRLAECYGLSGGTDIYSSAFKLSTNKDSTWHASACAIRAEIVIKIVKNLAGSPDSWKKEKYQKSLKAIQLIVGNLPPAFVLKARAALCRDVFNLDNQKESTEFQDLGSSQAKPMDDYSESENIKCDQDNWFENHWFQFENDIDANDLIMDDTVGSEF